MGLCSLCVDDWGILSCMTTYLYRLVGYWVRSLADRVATRAVDNAEVVWEVLVDLEVDQHRLENKMRVLDHSLDTVVPRSRSLQRDLPAALHCGLLTSLCKDPKLDQSVHC